MLYNDQRPTRDDVTSEQLVNALHRFYGDDYQLREVLYAKPTNIGFSHCGAPS